MSSSGPLAFNWPRNEAGKVIGWGLLGQYLKNYTRVVTADDYGIVGDGVTDDTTAWNLAIAALNAGTIKALYIPSGYNILLDGTQTTEITATDAIIFGDGQDVSKIKISASAGTSAKFFSFNGAQDFTIRGLSFHNLNSTSLVAGSWQFEAYDSARVTLEDIWQQGAPFLRMGGAAVGPNQMKLRNVTGSAYKALGSPHVLVEDCSGAIWQDVRFGADSAAAHADFRFVKLCPQVGDNIDTMTIRDFIANETQNDVATTFEIDYSYDDIGTITIDRTNLEQSLKGLHVHNNNGSTGFLSRLSLTNVRTTPRITTVGSVGFHVQNTNNKLTTISASMCTFSAGNGQAIKVEGTASDLGHLDLEIGNSVIVDRRQGLGTAKHAVEIAASGVALRDCKFLSSRSATTDVDYITGSTFDVAVKFTADVRRAIITGNDFQACTASEVIDTTLITGLASGSNWAINNNLGSTAIAVYPDPHVRGDLLSGFDLINAAENGGFEKGDSSWTKGTGWAISSDSTNANSGNYVAVNTSTSGAASVLTNDALSACVPGDIVYAEAWMKTSATPTYTVARVRIDWLDKDQVVLSASAATTMSGEQLAYIINTVTATAPASAAYYRVSVQIQKTVGSIYLDSVFAFKKRDASKVLLNYPLYPPQFNGSTANQVGFSTDTALAGSAISIPSGSLKIGSRYKCKFNIVKTAAGTATPIVNVRFGTNGTTADTSRATLTFSAQTAAVDEGVMEFDVIFRVVGASAVIQVVGELRHRAGTTGLAATSEDIQIATSGAFDSSVASSILHLTVNGGASAAWTVSLVQSSLENLV